ncbi:MAG: LysR substrate-binding domain-containing protein, partial [Alphaproteobacteria bacterium]|nr:LysR substrate-binding domain-containing protein [Alphaproteobacteria bacterium]
MNRSLPPLTSLRAFEAAARHGRITDAAAELRVTHGAVSRQVKQLERHLGVALFRRQGSGVALTDTGARLLPVLTSAFDLMESGVAQATQHDEPGLTVSCLGTFMMRWLIPRLFDFRAAHPEVEVRLSAADSTVDFDRDEADLAIRTGRAPWPTGSVAIPFIREKVGPVLSPELQAQLALRAPEDLSRAVLLHTETRRSAWPDWLTRTGCRGLDASAGEHFEHFYFMLQAAASGLGVAIGPRPLVQDDIEAGRLVAPFGFVDSGQSYAMLRPLAGKAQTMFFETWLIAQ